jgi:nucleoside-diphosphate-sugar epimerase
MRTILLTGASGVIGRAVAKELESDRVIGMVHADTSVPEVDEVCGGDIAAPRLGLTHERWRELASEVDVIVHSAGLTEWGQPRERYDAINVNGTRRVIELAVDAGASVHFLSTCFVNAIERDALDEMGPDNVVRPYIASKLESERLLAESGVPHTIFRPTNLVGDSRTGASSRPQIVQALSEWICRGKAPFIAAHRGNLVDVVPLDVMAIAVARAVQADDLGRLYWVTYGEQAMTVEEAIDVVKGHARARGKEIGRTRIIDPRDGLPMPLDEVPAISRLFVKVMIDVSEVTYASGGVLPSSSAELVERHGVPMPSDVEAYRLSLEYWAAQRAGTAVAEEAR